MLFFYLIKAQYFKIAKNNVCESNSIAAEMMQENFNNILSYMNDLTLKMYSNEKLNRLCNQIYLQEYMNDTERESLAFEAKNQCYDYLLYYQFIQTVGIFLEDDQKTDIYLSRSYEPNMYKTIPSFRDAIQPQIIFNKGVIKCFDIGDDHRLVFARTLKDFSNASKDDRILGTVMISIRKQYIMDALNATIKTPNSYSVLVNQDGVITYSTKEELSSIKLEEVQNKENWSDKNEPLQLFKQIDALNQKLIIVTPIEDISLSNASFVQTLIQFVAALTILNFILVVIISKMLTNPINHFVRQIQNIGTTNEIKYVTASGYSEIDNAAVNFNNMLDRVENLMNENYLVSLNEKNARIRALQSQINPHFIFNTLDTINWKVMFLNMPEVTNMITCLGGMLRYTTYQYGKYVTLKQEIEQISNYLYIQEIRYDHSFKTYFFIDEKAKNQTIPCLIIQPLVENAVVHGLKSKEEKGILVIRIKIRDDKMEIMVFDNGQGMDKKTIHAICDKMDVSDRESIGLSNVNQRICLTYSLEQGLTVKSKQGFYTRIEMRLPLKKEKQNDTGNCS